MNQNPVFGLLSKLEAVAAAATLIGLGMKWVLQPGGDVLVIVGLSTLALVYFVQAFIPVARVDEDARLRQPFPASHPGGSAGPRAVFPELIAPVVAGIGAATALIGSLFKLLAWNGSTVQLAAGCVGLAIALLAMASAGRISRRYALVLAFAAGIWATPAETLIRQFHRNDPVLTQLLLHRLHHPRDRAAGEAVRQYYQLRRKPAGAR